MSRLIRLGRRKPEECPPQERVWRCTSSAGPSYGSRVKSGRLDHREHRGRRCSRSGYRRCMAGGLRSSFSGGLGMFWIPLWLAVARRAPVLQDDQQAARSRVKEMLRDRRYLSLVVANILAMTIYSLWTNWTTVFLVSSYGLQPTRGKSAFRVDAADLRRRSADCWERGWRIEPSEMARCNHNGSPANFDSRLSVRAGHGACSYSFASRAGGRSHLRQLLRGHLPERQLLRHSIGFVQAV